MAGTLHSDHINYLIFRYLQEHGHENAATALWRDWHRPREYRNPEDFPFARIVQRSELIAVIQKGLLYDELSQKSGRQGRRFRWSSVNPRVPLDAQDVEALMQNGGAGSRPNTSGGKRRGKAPGSMRAPDEFPTPAPKRQRKNEGVEGAHVNGDIMDVEPSVVSPSVADGEEEGGEAFSPAIGLEVDLVEVNPERYDSVMTQTETKPGLKTTTMYWEIDRPNVTIWHNTWNPNADSARANTLLMAGEGLCRFYDIPKCFDDMDEIEHYDDVNVEPHAAITASAWHPEGNAVILAVDSARELCDGRRDAQQQLLYYHMENGSSLLDPGPSLLEPPGIVFHVSYSPKGDYVLAVQTNAKRGLVQVWHAPSESKAAQSLGWCIFEHEIYDACWSADDRFIVCGDKGLLRELRLAENSKNQGQFTDVTVLADGLEQMHESFPVLEQSLRKLQLNHDAGVAAVASIESRLLVTHPLRGSNSNETGEHVKLPGHLTALAFQPSTSSRRDGDKDLGGNGELQKTSLLAAAFAEGCCMIYRVDDISAKCEEVVKLDLTDRAPALALSWAPDGQYLAISSIDCIDIWRTEDLMERKKPRTHVPCVTWRPDAAAFEKLETRNAGFNHEQDVRTEPSLSWSADGKSLGFAAERQVAVIRFRQPSSAEANGHDNGDDRNGEGSP
ncbi:MAG: hypothetical protein FE78DRAFT_150167 [Acidomyces sp. 'richmondensis']|nr:MAG: hypothetical protein FE78DRAFT_150167 [Acidomyces sp. 'richmondensis']